VDQCRQESPPLELVGENHWAACWRAKEIDLPGIAATHGILGSNGGNGSNE
jgi:hypothetical protein